MSRRSPKGEGGPPQRSFQILQSAKRRGIGRRFVYILRSESEPDRHYVGRTADVDERLDVAQSRAVRLHDSSSPVASDRFPRVSRRTSGGQVRALPQIGLGPCFRQAALRRDAL